MRQLTAKPVIEIDRLEIQLHRHGQILTPVRDVSLSLRLGQITALVGESGSGKSLTALSLLRLLPKAVTCGHIWLFNEGEKTDLLALPEKEIKKLRGCVLSMIFQDPFAALNPVFSVGQQVVEALRLHQVISPKVARGQVIDLFAKVGLPNPKQCFKKYPHELSGGMRQRVMIAMAMICRPQVLIADEPTTALDVTVQAQIIALLHALKEEFGVSILLITHDMGVVAELADEVAVMYAGQVIEYTDVYRLFQSPTHPYTEALLASVPKLNSKTIVKPIPGAPPPLTEKVVGCSFYKRCQFAKAHCLNPPPLQTIASGFLSRCFYAEQRLP